MTLAPIDLAVDPQLGRFILDLAALAATAEDLRVDYLLAPAARIEDAAPFAFAPAAPEAFAFAADGGIRPLRDAFDGTPIAVAVRLGGAIGDYHGTARGWRILRNGVDLGATLPAELRSLDDVAAPVTPGRIAVDPERGRFKLPAGLLAPGDVIRVSFAAEDVNAQAARFASFAQQISHGLPAGVVPVVVDSRATFQNPATLS
jgi:hypothetical protein